MIISYACLIWIGYFSFPLKCNCINEQKEVWHKEICRQSDICRNESMYGILVPTSFLPNVAYRRYENYDQLLPELQKYMPGYEKTKRYFIRTNLYKYLTENGDLERAMSNSEKLCQLCKESPEDLKAYSEIHKVIELLNK